MESVCCFANTFVLITGLLMYAGTNSQNVNTGSVMGCFGNPIFHTKLISMTNVILINHTLQQKYK